MATRINTKFVIILASVLVVLTAGAVFAVLQLKKSAADHARLAETYMTQAEQDLAAGNIEEANSNYNEAARHFITARNKEPRNTDYLRRFIDARNGIIYDDMALATAELRSIMLTHAVSLHDTPGATSEDRKYLYEMINDAARMGLVVDGLEDLNALMLTRANTRLLTSENDKIAQRYAAIAYSNLIERETDADKRQELLDRLNSLIEENPDDPWLYAARGRYYIGVGFRVLSDNNNTPNEEYYALQALARESLDTARELSADNPAALIETARFLFAIQPNLEEPESRTELIAMRFGLLDQIDNLLRNKDAREQLYTRELGICISLLQNAAGNEEFPFDGPQRAEALARAVVEDRPNDPQAYEALGNYYNSQGMYEKAAETLEDGLATSNNTNAVAFLLEQHSRLNMLPTLITAKLNLAARADSESERDEILAEIDRLTDRYENTPTIDEQERDARADLIRGQTDIVGQNWGDAIEHLLDASTAYRGQNLQVLQLLASCYTQNNQPTKVIETYNDIIGIQPQSPIRLELARLYFNQNTDQATQRARQQVGEFLRYYPGNPQGTALLARLLYRSENPESKEAAIRLLEDQDLEANPELRALLAQLRASEGDTADLLTMAREQIANRPEGEPIYPAVVRQVLALIPDAQDKIAEINRLVADGLSEDAAAILRILATEGTLTLEQELALIDASGYSEADAASRKFDVYRQFNEPDLAREQLALASRLDPDAAGVMASQLTVALEEERWDDAERAIQQILSLPLNSRPDIAVDNGVFLRALVAAARSQAMEPGAERNAAMRRAAAMYTSALERNPSRTEGWIKLGQLNLMLNDMDAAKAALREALRLQSTNLSALEFMAQAEVRTGEFRSAIGRLEEVYRRTPSNLNVLDQLTQIAMSLDEPERAIGFREALRETDPDNISNRRQLAGLYAQEQSNQWYAKARREMDAIIEAEGMNRQNFELIVTLLIESENQDQVPAVARTFIDGLGDQAQWQDHLIAAVAYSRVNENTLAAEQYAVATEMEGADSNTSVLAWASALSEQEKTAEAIALLERYATQKTNGNALLVQAANLYIQQGQLGRAMAIANALPQSPERYDIMIRTALATENQFGTALSLAEQAAAAYPDNLRLRLQNAELKLAVQNRRPEGERNFAEALGFARAIRSDFPDRVEPMIYHANVLLAMNNSEEAFRVLTAARQISPRNAQVNELYYTLLQYKALAAAGTNPQESLRLAGQALAVGTLLLEEQPDNPQLLRSMGEAATMLRRTEDAVKYFGRAFQITGQASELEAYVQTLLNLGQASEALALLEDQNTAVLVNNNLVLRAMRGRALAASGQRDRAAALFGNILRTSEGPEAQAMLTRQTVIAFNDDPRRAVQIVQEGLGQNVPAVIDATLAAALSGAELYSESAALLNKYLRNPAEPEDLQFRLLQQLGLSLQMSDQLEEAKVAYEQALAIMEGNPEGLDPMQRVFLLNNLAYMLADQLSGYETQAVSYARQAYELMPDNQPPDQRALIEDTLGVALLKDGQFDEAIRVLRQSRQNAELTTNLIHLGQAYLAKGDYNRARQALLDAVRVAESENDAEAKQEAEALLEQAGQANQSVTQ